MPSKGTPRRTFRFADQFWTTVEEAVDRRNFWTQREPWTLSDFVRIAIAEKLAKMKRCRRRRPRRLAVVGQAVAIAADKAVAVYDQNG